MEYIRKTQTITNGQSANFNGQNYLNLLKVGMTYKKDGVNVTDVTGTLTLTGFFATGSKGELIAVIDLSSGFTKTFKNSYNIISAAVTNLVGADTMEITIIQNDGTISSGGGTGGDGAIGILVSSDDDTVKQTAASEYDEESRTIKVALSATGGGGKSEVKTVAGIKPDLNGNVALKAGDISAYTKTEVDTKVRAVDDIATTANKAAGDALTKATTADQNASKALVDVTAAKSTADEAKLAAAAAQKIADQGVKDAAAAKSVADTAQSTATAAKTSADGANTRIDSLAGTVTSSDSTVIGTMTFDKATNSFKLALQAKSGTAGSYSSNTLVVDNTKNTIELGVDAASFEIVNRVLKLKNAPMPVDTSYKIDAGGVKGINTSATLIPYEDATNQTYNLTGLYINDNCQIDLTLPFTATAASKKVITLTATVVNSTNAAISVDVTKYELFGVTADHKLVSVATQTGKLAVVARQYSTVTLATLTVASMPSAMIGFVLRVADFGGIGSKKVGLVNNLVFTIE